ncbi:MAG TPA: hypothetical protein VGK63_09260 [Candidatus Limnocylindrales bacterium]
MTWPGDRSDDLVAPYDYAPEPPPPRERPRRLVTPTRVTLLVAIIGSLVYLAYAITVRDTQQIPLLASGAAVLGLVFLALAAAGGLATFHAGRDGHVGRALVVAIGGGIAGVISAGAFAFALVLALAYRG